MRARAGGLRDLGTFSHSALESSLEASELQSINRRLSTQKQSTGCLDAVHDSLMVLSGTWGQTSHLCPCKVELGPPPPSAS